MSHTSGYQSKGQGGSGTAQSSRSSTSTRLAAIAGLVLAMLSGLVISATAAGAHHAELSASAVCADGGRSVDFTARSWRTYRPQDADAWRALNPSIEVLWRFPGGTATVGATGAFTPASLDGSNIPVFSGRIALPASDASVVQLQVHAVGNWGPNPANGETVAGGQWWPGRTQFLQVSLPTDCRPSNPAVTINECAEGGIAVTLTNIDGGRTAVFDVNGTKLEVAPNTSVVHLIAATEGETVRIVVSADGNGLVDHNVTHDCLFPDPGVGGPECAEGGLVVTLVNSGNDQAVYVVNDAEIVVPAHGSVAHLITVAEGETVRITVSSGGVTLLDQTATRDCQHPVPGVGETVDCVDDGLVVTLTNSGDDDALFNVNTVEVAVSAASEKAHWIAAAEDQTIRITVTSAGATLLDEDVTRNCDEPEVSKDPPTPTAPTPTVPTPTVPTPTVPATPVTTPTPPAATPTTVLAARQPAARATQSAAPRSNPASLARTGTTTDDLLALAAGLSLAGSLLVATTKRRASRTMDGPTM